MKVLVVEYITAGGALDDVLSSNITAEAVAMVQSLTSDLVACNHDVTVLFSPRYSRHHVAGKCVEVRDFWPALEYESLRADTVVAIAPECNNILSSLSARLDILGVDSIGSTPDAIDIAADKKACTQLLEARSVATVPLGSMHSKRVVVKPRTGVGCSDTIVTDAAQLSDRHTLENSVVQPFLIGESVSVLAAVGSSYIVPFCAGKQHIVFEHVTGSRDMTLSYGGGEFPVTDELNCRAQKLAESAIRSVDGLRGFVGVDILLDSHTIEGEVLGDVVVEINPRMTTSYVGLRALTRRNLAEVAIAIAHGAVVEAIEWWDRRITFTSCGEVCGNRRL